VGRPYLKSCELGATASQCSARTFGGVIRRFLLPRAERDISGTVRRTLRLEGA
jgi:hypothetical protein